MKINQLSLQVLYRAINHAAKNGRLDIVEYLHLNRTEGCSTLAMDKAAMNGHFNVVQWLHWNRKEGGTTNALDFASTLEIVEFLDKNRQEGATKTAMDNAALMGRLDIIKYLDKNRTEGCSAQAIDNSIRNNHPDITKWLVENRSERFQAYSMDYAIKPFQETNEMIYYIHENSKIKCTPNATKAIEMGRLDLVEFFYQHYRAAAMWTYGLTPLSDAAFNGHLDIVQFLFKTGNYGHHILNAIERASNNGHLNVIKFLYLNRTNEMNLSKSLSNAINYNQHNNNYLDVVKYIIETDPKGYWPKQDPPQFKRSNTQAYDVFSLLLEYKMIDSTKINSDYIRLMYSRGLFELVDLCNSLSKINTKIENESNITIPWI
ncbi:hypothetical protein DFA_04173 [Cavenderia fasciculata]|uniref:Ankyrin repeat-containing protein n=1 Tax=Cavenderia fasciculata TaxID=261658 RepID=F4Q1H6_CACFS|nr:uncharacterized protein DFA_04173 [Cavenderia fasciculata]EGG18677.1 hypothetical protein DFA_04173 [Cavenderia fasciculata]|eukprot:XP_004366581.1 hypothetical protein DFA_04173 [Cavenderia fasciculata]